MRSVAGRRAARRAAPAAGWSARRPPSGAAPVDRRRRRRRGVVSAPTRGTDEGSCWPSTGPRAGRPQTATATRPAGTARRLSTPHGTSVRPALPPRVPGRATPLPSPVRPRAAQREESPVREWSERVRFGTRPPSRIVPRHRADGLLSPRPDWPGARRARGRADGRQGGRVRGAVAGQPRRSGDVLARRCAGDRLADGTDPGPRMPGPRSTAGSPTASSTSATTRWTATSTPGAATRPR